MNNDRFKFRVWDKKKKYYAEMIDDDSFILNHHGTLLIVHYNSISGQDDLLWPDDYGKDHYLLECCTGMKDKNGRLIYEGDIVNFYPAETKDHEKRIVLWGKDHWTTYKKSSWGANIYWCFGKHKMEIVGNIHESEVKE